jgi:fibro-slime domain-containing protein
MRRRSKSFPSAMIVLAFALGGCSSDSGESAENGGSGGGGKGGSSAGSGTGGVSITGGSGGGGGSANGSGSGGSANAGNCTPELTGTVRDFRAWDGGIGHPDFQTFTGNGEKGLVLSTLGTDHKPVFAHTGDWSGTNGGCNRGGENGVRCVTSPESFEAWYRDVSGVNQAIEHTITLTVDAGGIGTYANSAFFPIDNQGFGNEGRDNNFHFTFELHMEFEYKGGEIFSFSGDDDLWVFINNRLAIDLGGLHPAQEDSISLDQRAAELGITPGNIYPLDFFHAERHTSESNFKIQSSLAFTNCDPIVY